MICLPCSFFRPFFLMRGRIGHFGTSASFPIFLLALIFPMIALANIIGDHGSFSALNHMLRAWKYILVYFLALQAFKHDGELDRFSRFVAKTCIVLFIISGAQFVDLFSLNALYIPYTAPTQFLTLVAGFPWPRSVGMTGGPNELGTISAIGGVFFLWCFLRKGGILFVFAFLVCGACLYFSGSRTSLVAFMVGFSIIFLFISKNIGDLAFRIAISAGSFVLAFIFMTDVPGFEKLGIYSDLLNVRESASLSARFVAWDYYINTFGITIFGHGAMNVVASTSMDSEYVIFLMRYGWFGLVWLIVFFLGSIFIYKTAAALVGATSVSILVLIIMSTSSVFHSHIVMPFFLLIFAFFISHDGQARKQRIGRSQ